MLILPLVSLSMALKKRDLPTVTLLMQKGLRQVNIGFLSFPPTLHWHQFLLLLSHVRALSQYVTQKAKPESSLPST